MKQHEFEALILDKDKYIDTDIIWEDDEDHSPTVEFRVEVRSESGYPIFIKGSYNPLIYTLTYAIIHRKYGRIYALDMGKDHHNPSCNNVGEKHKHRWKEAVRDKEAYVPEDITSPSNVPIAVWQQFCEEAKITHRGNMKPPPPLQWELDYEDL